jgi:hypothetical protein
MFKFNLVAPLTPAFLSMINTSLLFVYIDLNTSLLTISTVVNPLELQDIITLTGCAYTC